MKRSTAGLFVPLFETVVLSAICFPALHAFFSSISLDYSPVVRHSILGVLVLSLTTGLLQLLLSAAEKTPFVGQQTLIKNPRHAMYIANAYCCGIALLLYVFASLFVQATTFAGQLDASLAIERGPSAASSQQADWVYSIVGASGGWVLSPDRTKKIPVQPVTAPFMGSIYGGLTMGYMGISFLLSLYISYMATPESASSYVFLEPRFLAIEAGFLGFGVSDVIRSVYGGCADPAVPIILFCSFVLAACFFDLILLYLGGGSKESKLYVYGKWAGLQALAIVPLFFLGSLPDIIKVCCGISVAAATLANAIDLVFRGWDPLVLGQQQQQQLDDAAAAAATTKSALDWQMMMPPPLPQQHHQQRLDPWNMHMMQPQQLQQGFPLDSKHFARKRN